MKHQGVFFFSLGVIIVMLFGWYIFPRMLYRSIEQPLQFSHKVHTGEAAGQSCQDCHVFKDDGSFAGVPSMSTCEGCHSSVIGTSYAESIFVANYVVPKREVSWLVYARQPQNVYFSHVFHVKLANISCERCHGSHGQTDGLRPYQVNSISGYSRDLIDPSTAAGEGRGGNMMECSQCHQEHSLNESCIDCHK